MEPHIQFIHDLVAIPSVSGNEEKASQYLVQQMQERGAEARVDEVNNAVGIWGSGEKELWLVGHIDTVPGDIPVEIKDGKLYGRGSVDAKGCLATFVEAVSQVSIPEDWKVMVVGCVEEEVASSKGARHLLDRKRPEAVIIGEPSSVGKITISYKGTMRCQLRFETTEEHTSTVRENAHEQAVAFWNAIKGWADEYNQEKSISQLLQVSLISINSTNDGFKNVCDMEIRFRIPVGMSCADIEKKLKTSDFRLLTLNCYGKENPILAEKNSLLVRAFLKGMRAEGLQPRFSKKTGTADMNVIGNHFEGVPTLAYGPGDSKLDHTPEEHLELAEYEQAIEVLKKGLESFLSA